jgi:hypothetical protein
MTRTRLVKNEKGIKGKMIITLIRKPFKIFGRKIDWQKHLELQHDFLFFTFVNQSFATFNWKLFGNFLVSLINQSSSKSVWFNYRESTVSFRQSIFIKTKCHEFPFMTEFKEVEINGIFWPINFKIHETYFPFYVRFLQ